MKLHALQRAVARAVMQPLTRSERMQRKAPGGGRMSAYAARFIKPNDRLTSFERLEIYNRQYWFRVLASLAEDYPGLRAVLGGRRFEAMCKAYLTECPSRSFTLRNLGAQLAAWLRQNARWISDRRVLALDMVRLEWADIEAFDGEAKPALRSEDLREAKPASLQLDIQPYVQLLDLHYPVDDLLLEVKHGDDTPDRASNAVQERRKTQQGPCRGEARGRRNLSGRSSSGFSPSIFAASSRKSSPFSPRCEAERPSSAPSTWLSAKVPSLRPTARLCSTFVSNLGGSRLVLPARGKQAR